MKSRLFALGLATALALPGGAAVAADHRDGAALQTPSDPSVDINDVYSWVSADGMKVYLAMTVFPQAMAGAKFSNSTVYVFHTASRAAFDPTGADPLAIPVDIPCTFDTMQRITCWVPQAGGNPLVVAGDASKDTGISDASGKVKVYAGLRKDHFFFNLEGWNRVRTLYKQSAMQVTKDASGCLTGPGSVRTSLVNALSQDKAGMTPPVDAFRNFNTLAIVLEVDRALLTKGGSLLSVWAATRMK
jgi:hypothetical protein